MSANMQTLLALKDELSATGMLKQAVAIEWALGLLADHPEAIVAAPPPDVDLVTVCTTCPIKQGKRPHEAKASRKRGRWSVSCRRGAGTTLLSKEALESFERRAAEVLGHA